MTDQDKLLQELQNLKLWQHTAAYYLRMLPDYCTGHPDPLGTRQRIKQLLAQIAD